MLAAGHQKDRVTTWEDHQGGAIRCSLFTTTHRQLQRYQTPNVFLLPPFSGYLHHSASVSMTSHPSSFPTLANTHTPSPSFPGHQCVVHSRSRRQGHPVLPPAVRRQAATAAPPPPPPLERPPPGPRAADWWRAAVRVGGVSVVWCCGAVRCTGTEAG